MRFPRALFAASLVAVLSSPPLRAGDLADEADLHFQLGTDEFRAHHFNAALEHFLASNRLVPNNNVVANIAATYVELKRYPEAFRYYTQALAAEGDPAEKAALQKSIDRITPLVAVLRVETNPPGATVYIDRKDLGPRGQTPAVLGFTQAKVKVMVEDEGYDPAQSADIDLSPGTTTRVALQLNRVVGTVKMTGNPYGAVVTVENFPDIGCALPCSLQLPPGRRTLVVNKEGYIPSFRRLEIPARDTITTDFQLAPVTGGLVVSADEKGASVEVDGHLVGFTPVVLEVPIGERQIHVALAGFQTVETTATVKAGEQAKVDVSMAPADEISAVSRVAEKLDDAPSSVSVISGNELRAMNYPTLVEALRGVRGLFVNDDGTYETVGVRGYGPAGGYGNTVLILVDGHPTNDDWADSSYAGYDQRTSLEDIDHIEIVRGPGSVVYGTGAFVGVINLVTKPHSAPREANASIATVDNGRVRASANAHQPLSESAGFDLAVSGLDGAQSAPFYGLLADGVSYGFTQSIDRLTSGTAAGKVWLGAFTLEAQAVARDRQYPVQEDYVEQQASPSSVIDRRAFVEARYEPHLGSIADLLLRASYDRYTEDSLGVYGAGDYSRARFVGDWVDGEARITLRPHPSLRLMLGGEAQDHFHVSQDGYSVAGEGEPAVSYLNSETPYRFYAAYGLADWFVVPALHLSAGVRLDNYSTFGSSVNPRLALIWKPSDNDVLKLMAGSAFRAPSIYELYYNDGGASQVAACASTSGSCNALQPETVKSIELEYTHHIDSAWTGLVSGWATRIENTIELSQAPGQDPGISQYQNTSAPIDGLGAELELRREWRQGWMFELNGSVQQLWFDQPGDTAAPLGEVPNSPRLQAGAKFAMPLVPRYLSLMTRVSLEGPRWDRDDEPGDPAQEASGYGVIWDASITGQIPEWHVRGALSLYNIADWQYALPLSREFGAQISQPQSGRRLLATLAFSF